MLQSEPNRTFKVPKLHSNWSCQLRYLVGIRQKNHLLDQQNPKAMPLHHSLFPAYTLLPFTWWVVTVMGLHLHHSWRYLGVQCLTIPGLDSGEMWVGDCLILLSSLFPCFFYSIDYLDFVNWHPLIRVLSLTIYYLWSSHGFFFVVKKSIAEELFCFSSKLVP